MRDTLQAKVFKACLYKKLLLWNDLNIQCDEWVGKKTVEVIGLINEFQEIYKYIPTRIELGEVSLESAGYFGFLETTGDNCESTEYMDSMVESIADMENIIKKNFLNKKDKTLITSNIVQMTLREELEISN